jgi:endonuclease YncB( thermonuclease family)
VRRLALLAPLLAVLLGLLAAVAAALAAAPADAAWKAPCREDGTGPTCTFWDAKVTFVDDGDTIEAVVAGSRTRRSQLVRFTGINAMELYRYSKYASRRRGACHGLAAAALVERYVKGSHWRVRLSAQRASSVSGGRRRLRRSVWVKAGGRWRDLARLEMEQGLALWLPNGQEWAHNGEYHALAEQAALAQRGLYDPDSCGAGPDQDLPISVSVNWDADGNDSQNVAGEWVDIRNGGPRPLALGGWWFRDSWLYYNDRPASGAVVARAGVPGYAFPADAVVAPFGSLRLHVGCGPDSGTDLYWCQHSDAFENASTDGKQIGDGGYLFDPQGDLRAWQIYPCLTACLDPLAGQVRVTVRAIGKPEWIEVTNVGGAPVDLGDHVLQERSLGKADAFIFSYGFRWGTVLQPQQSIRFVPGGALDSAGAVRHLGSRISGFADGGGQVTLRTQTNLITDCSSWGRGHC